MKKGHRRKKERVILDSNIINGFCSDKPNIRKKATTIAHERDKYLYTENVHKELTASKNDCLHRYAARHRKRMILTGMPSLREWISMPKKIGKDRFILHDAVKTDADIIVSSDKKFKRYADGYEGIAVMKPSDYVSSREDSKNNKRQKK